MAEFKRLPTQEELSQMLYQMQLGGKSQQDIINENLAGGSTVKAIPENMFQKMAKGAGIAKEQVNKLGNAADLAKLFPGYTGQSQVNIPTGYNFAMKQSPTGEAMPAGMQSQPININQLLQAIKPADMLGLAGAQQAYTDVGMGKAPNAMDVMDVAGLGAAGIGAGKGLLSVAKATKGLPVGMGIKDVSKNYLLGMQVKPFEFSKELSETKVLDDSGNLKMVFHGTQRAPEGIKEFNPTVTMESGYKKESSNPSTATWFSDSPSDASNYSSQIGGSKGLIVGNPTVYPTYLNIKNLATQDTVIPGLPHGFDAEIDLYDPSVVKKIKDAGYDGVVYSYIDDPVKNYVVFDKNQIISPFDKKNSKK